MAEEYLEMRQNIRNQVFRERLESAWNRLL
jgi:hypothetical protein